MVLHTAKTPFKSTDQLINRIMFNFVNRGVLITIVQISFVVWWFAQPTTFNWAPFYFATGKLYLTTLLALLNMRGRTQNKYSNMDPFGGHSYTLKNPGNAFGQNATSTLAEAPAIVARTVEIFNENVCILAH
ncbi:hypothetical protein K439DRAFT_535079 [Ramaria rubella]|nr:hypothetical protein K439DRAFT_535079 [Ramaria rubella]